MIRRGEGMDGRGRRGTPASQVGGRLPTRSFGLLGISLEPGRGGIVETKGGRSASGHPHVYAADKALEIRASMELKRKKKAKRVTSVTRRSRPGHRQQPTGSMARLSWSFMRRTRQQWPEALP